SARRGSSRAERAARRASPRDTARSPPPPAALVSAFPWVPSLSFCPSLDATVGAAVRLSGAVRSCRCGSLLGERRREVILVIDRPELRGELHHARDFLQQDPHGRRI